MKTLTVFTPTYNRRHTLPRTYESLCRQTSKDFEWLIIDDGSTDDTQSLVSRWISEKRVPIRYIYKENGGLHTGYNTAYANIETELNVCIDSDDFMPEDAVEIIVNHWKNFGSDRYAGITGLDFTPDGQPIGGYFPPDMTEGFLVDFKRKYQHRGDTKQVMRTDIMKSIAPQTGFPGEKFFNPFFMIMKADQMLPSLFINKNLCFVDYQEADSMSGAIFHQYLNSPHSMAAARRYEMTIRRNSFKNILRLAIHYNSSTIIACEKDWLRTSPKKSITLLTRPLGYLLSLYIRHKCKASRK